MTNGQINKEIRAICEGIRQKHETISAESRLDYMQHMKPGEAVPPEGRIYGKEHLEKYREEVRAARGKLEKLLDGSVGDLKAKTTAAPSADAVNAITLLGLRDDVKAGDVEAMLEQYGDNVLAYQSIASIARKNGVHGVADNPTVARITEVETLRDSLQRVLADQEMTDPSTPFAGGKLSFITAMGVDEVFPPEN